MSDAPTNFHELWAALRSIREAVEELAPPGSVANDEYLAPEPMREAEAIIRGIQAIAEAREADNRSNLGSIIEALHDSEINGSLAWFFDGVWNISLGDDHSGIAAEATVNTPQEAAEWLRANAVGRYPRSGFAKGFP